MKWVTQARPKVDRVACPWLIKRFVDPQAEFLYVPASVTETRTKKPWKKSHSVKEGMPWHTK